MASKSEMVYEELKRKILAGEFSPGFRLVLARIAEDHGVSPVPVREALRRLEAEGLVRYTLNVGAEVVGVNPNDYAETMQTLAVLEGAATRLAAPVLDGQSIRRARSINDEMRAVRTDLDPLRFTRLNHEFHRVVCGACPNAHLRDLLEREWDRMSQIRHTSFSYVPDRSTQSVEEHEKLIELIVAKAPAAEVEELARAHKLRTLERFLAGR